MVIYLKYIFELVEFFRDVFKEIEVELFKVYYEVNGVKMQVFFSCR